MEGSLHCRIFGQALGFILQPVPAFANAVHRVVDVDAAQRSVQSRNKLVPARATRNSLVVPGRDPEEHRDQCVSILASVGGNAERFCGGELVCSLEAYEPVGGWHHQRVWPRRPGSLGGHDVGYCTKVALGEH